MIDDAAKRKILGLVGLGIRGRLAVVGVQQVREAARRGKVKIALVAGDASQNSLDKVESLLAARGVRVIGDLSSSELGEIAGRESVAVIGVSDAGLAKGITDAIKVEYRR
ncbi:MAG TPA: ribosomal L7Ae/L30e/S12e/Gadd45 family protein [Gemmatimonadaceae bacterium]